MCVLASLFGADDRERDQNERTNIWIVITILHISPLPLSASESERKSVLSTDDTHDKDDSFLNVSLSPLSGELCAGLAAI